MSEQAHEFQPTSPTPEPTFQPDPPAAVEPQRCALCEAPLPAQLERCPSCGLWMGGRANPLNTATLWWVAGVFAAVYCVAILLVALAR